jgi:hypothetical protein
MNMMRWFLCILLLVILQAGAGAAAESRTISLNGDWQFVADPARTLTVADLPSANGIRPTRVPSSWQQQFADLRDYAGVAWYWRSVDVNPPAAGGTVFLRFGAVDYLADVFVNGEKVGSHEGGYLPFEFNITGRLRSGENQIAVRVVDPGPTAEVEGIKYAEIPHGKQDWYVQTSGLWQDVELRFRPRTYVQSVHIAARADGRFKIAAQIAGPPPAAASGEAPKLRAQILDPQGKPVWSEERPFVAGQSGYEFAGQLPDASPWSPAHPALYKVRVTGPAGDHEEHRFGFRTFEKRGGKFYLNGKVIYLRGALDQDFYPDTIYTPPSFDYLRDEMRQAKALGLNLLRCHIKVPDPRYLAAADEVGLLVWYEIPSWDKLTEDSKRRALATLRGMAERDWNHPSIVIVSVINEAWGADLREAPERAWLQQAVAEAQATVPDWLVVDNSACCQNFHLATDIADFHQYQAIPDNAADFDRFVADLARRPGWLFSPYGDAAPRGDEPLMLSEFGNWGLPGLPATQPWWFGRGFREHTIVVPEGVERRFAEHGYDELFPHLSDLLEATQWCQFRSLKFEIEAIRTQATIQGYVITEFTDLNWEANGLLDMWRKPKVYAEDLRKLQQDDLLILRAERRNLQAGETAKAEVYFSYYSSEPLAGAQVAWQVGNAELGGNLVLPALSPGATTKVGQIEFPAPNVPKPTRLDLQARLVVGSRAISESSLPIYVYPVKSPDLPPPVAFHDPPRRLRRLVNEMRARNYLEPTGRETYPVLIASTFDDEVKRRLQLGARVILVASDRQALAPGLEIVPRAGSYLDGNWISSFLWIRKDQAPFRDIGFETFPGFEAQVVAPRTVVQGVPAAHFSDVLAGFFYGWLHSNVGALVQARYGQGRLLICTFALATSYGSDPYATHLLDSLVRYAVSSFSPQFEIPLSP